MRNDTMRDESGRVDGAVPYRVLLTGVPPHVSCEAFYDALRAHTSELCVHNAWLVQVTHADDEDASRTRTRSTGAAFVDFCSKHDAESVMQAGALYVDGVAVEWEGVGPVLPSPGTHAAAHRAAAAADLAAGKAAYEARRWRPRDRARTRRHRGNDSRSDDKATHHNGGAIAWPSSVGEVTLRLTRCDVRTRRDGNNDDNDDACAVSDADLFVALDAAVRHCTLGCVHSLERLHSSEVHLVTDEHSAAALLERGEVATHCATTDASASTGTRDVVLRWRVHAHKRHSIDELIAAATTMSSSNGSSNSAAMTATTSESNLELAAKHEVLQAMATVMQASGGKYAAMQDKYGNLFFPASDSVNSDRQQA